jgi:hypothetical protein
VWAQVRDRRGRLFCWTNLATGDTRLLLPLGATSVEGWRAESPAGGGGGGAAAEGAVYRDTAHPAAPPRERLPPPELPHNLHWLPAPSRWALEPASGAWRRLRTPPQVWGDARGGGVGGAMWAPARARRRALLQRPPQARGVGAVVEALLLAPAPAPQGAVGGECVDSSEEAEEGGGDVEGGEGTVAVAGGDLPPTVPTALALPVGAVTRGGWRLVADPSDARAALWVHPGLGEMRRAAPGAEEEAAGLRAREAAEAGGWGRRGARREDEPPPPAEPSPHGVWRLAAWGGGEAHPPPPGARALPWVQDGSGARRALPPAGAALPWGWAVEEAAPGGDAHFLHAETGARQRAVPDLTQPPPRGRRVAREGDGRLWGRVRDADTGLRVWEHFTSGRRLPPTEAPPLGSVLRGGWEVVPGDKPPNNLGAHSLLFHAARGLLRGWERLPEEAEAEWDEPWAPRPATAAAAAQVQAQQPRPSAALAYLGAEEAAGAGGGGGGGGDSANATPDIWHRFLPEGLKRHVWRCGRSGAIAEHDGDLPLGAETEGGWRLVGNGEGERWWAHDATDEVAWRGPWEAAEHEARARQREARRAGIDREARRERRRRRRAEREGAATDSSRVGSSSAAEDA